MKTRKARIIKRKAYLWRVVLVLELVVTMFYVFFQHAWDGGMFHTSIAALIKDLAEV